MNMSELLLTSAWQANKLREQEETIAQLRDQVGKLRGDLAQAQVRLESQAPQPQPQDDPAP